MSAQNAETVCPPENRTWERPAPHDGSPTGEEGTGVPGDSSHEGRFDSGPHPLGLDGEEDGAP